MSIGASGKQGPVDPFDQIIYEIESIQGFLSSEKSFQIGLKIQNVFSQKPDLKQLKALDICISKRFEKLEGSKSDERLKNLANKVHDLITVSLLEKITRAFNSNNTVEIEEFKVLIISEPEEIRFNLAQLLINSNPYKSADYIDFFNLNESNRASLALHCLNICANTSYEALSKLSKLHLDKKGIEKFQIKNPLYIKTLAQAWAFKMIYKFWKHRKLFGINLKQDRNFILSIFEKKIEDCLIEEVVALLNSNALFDLCSEDEKGQEIYMQMLRRCAQNSPEVFLNLLNLKLEKCIQSSNTVEYKKIIEIFVLGSPSLVLKKLEHEPFIKDPKESQSYFIKLALRCAQRSPNDFIKYLGTEDRFPFTDETFIDLAKIFYKLNQTDFVENLKVFNVSSNNKEWKEFLGKVAINFLKLDPDFFRKNISNFKFSKETDRDFIDNILIQAADLDLHLALTLVPLLGFSVNTDEGRSIRFNLARKFVGNQADGLLDFLNEAYIEDEELLNLTKLYVKFMYFDETFFGELELSDTDKEKFTNVFIFCLFMTEKLSMEKSDQLERFFYREILKVVDLERLKKLDDLAVDTQSEDARRSSLDIDLSLSETEKLKKITHADYQKYIQIILDDYLGKNLDVQPQVRAICSAISKTCSQSNASTFIELLSSIMHNLTNKRLEFVVQCTSVGKLNYKKGEEQYLSYLLLPMTYVTDWLSEDVLKNILPSKKMDPKWAKYSDKIVDIFNWFSNCSFRGLSFDAAFLKNEHALEDKLKIISELISKSFFKNELIQALDEGDKQALEKKLDSIYKWIKTDPLKTIVSRGDSSEEMLALKANLSTLSHLFLESDLSLRVAQIEIDKSIDLLKENLKKYRRDFKDRLTKTESLWLSLCSNLDYFEFLTAQDKINFLIFVTSGELSSQELRDNFSYAQALLNPDNQIIVSKVKGDSRTFLKKSFFTMINQDSFYTFDRHLFQKNYQSTFSISRNPCAWIIYAEGLKKLPEPDFETKVIKNAFNLFMASVLSNTFSHERYQDQGESKTPHIHHIASHNVELWEKWKTGVDVKKPEILGLEARYSIENTDQWDDLLLCGTEVVDSCQRVDGDPFLNVCLLGYLLNGYNRLIAIKNPNGEIVARSIFRVLWNETQKKPVLFLEGVYPKAPPIGFQEAITKYAKSLALALECDLYCDFQGAEYTESHDVIRCLGGIAPYEYADSADPGLYGRVFKKGHYKVADPYLL